MSTSPNPSIAPSITCEIGRFQPTLTIPREAYAYACELGRPVRGFAAEIHVLRAARLTHSAMSRFVSRGFIALAAETTRDGQDRRDFRPSGNLTFIKWTCFVLSETAAGPAQPTTDACPTVAIQLQPGRKALCPPPSLKLEYAHPGSASGSAMAKDRAFVRAGHALRTGSRSSPNTSASSLRKQLVGGRHQ